MDAAGPKPDNNDNAAKEIVSCSVEGYRRGQNDPEREARWAKWREENAEAIASSNAWVEKYGLPLARYRLF